MSTQYSSYIKAPLLLTYIKYTVKFVNDDGTEISSATYNYGDEVIEPTAPTKASDGNYTYTFAGWDSKVVACNGNKIYTATYSAQAIEKGGCGSIIAGSSAGMLTICAALAFVFIKKRKQEAN